MDIHILTLFPNMFNGPFDESIIGRAISGDIVRIHIHNIRDYSMDRRNSVDDYPYGGGGGMVLKPEPLFAAVEHLKTDASNLNTTDGLGGAPVILLSPKGRVLTQSVVYELKAEPSLILICGRYEGVDERVVQHLVDYEISIGDYVLSGGEIAAMALVDSVVRVLPGAVGDMESIADDTHSSGLIQFPQYTRPPEYRGWSVPSVLLSGNHQDIIKWRRQQSLIATSINRPDILDSANLSSEDHKFLGCFEESSGSS